jgi:AAA15 family ATPase/GTPase
MLVQLAIENYKSIEKEIVLKMMASGLKGHPNHKVKTKFNEPAELLRLGALYGANASGKTNLIETVLFVQNLIVEGTQPGELIDSKPFKLSKKFRSSPTTIEFVVYLEGQLYTYGFSVTKKEVVEEWLFAQRPGAKERKLFERISKNDQALVKTGKSLEAEDYSKKVLEMVARSTRVNQLYLHELVDKNHPGIRNLIDWFKNSLTVIPAVAPYRQLTLRAVKDLDFTDFVSRILKRVGTGIERVESRERKVDIERDLIMYPKALREQMSAKLNEMEADQGIFISSELMQRVYERRDGEIFEYRLETIHKDKEGNEVAFEMEDESDGTLRLMHLIPLLADIKKESKVVFVDELDRRMHPLLSKTLIRLFDEINPDENNSQLFFTTHDTNLFDQDLLRRDELWVMEKNNYGATNLKSIHEFKIRNDKKLDKDYLLGRFGGVPNIRYDVLEKDHA